MKPKRLLLFATKLGYQTRSFDAAAQKLGLELLFVTDRCHQLDDPWGDLAIPVHFESPEVAAYTVLQQVRQASPPVAAILALGDRPAVAAAYVARGLGLAYNHPAAVEACRSKLRMREVFRDAGLPVPWFRSMPLHPLPEPALLGISYPCVLKPLSLSASTGVIRANNREEFVSAAARVRRVLQSPEGGLLHRTSNGLFYIDGAKGTAFAARGRVVGGAPVEQPFSRSSIKQSQLRRTKWRLHQARVAHLLNMLAI